MAVFSALTGATETNPLTVLAPVDNAFATFLSDNSYADLDDVPTAALTATLFNHTINAFLTSSDLVAGGAGYTNTNATGAGSNPMSLYYNTSNGVTFNGISTVAVADIVATNGIVHAVDAVVTLPTVVTFATADPNFSTLVAALTREASFTYVATLSTANGTAPAPFTVFAPTNAAFADLLTELSLPI
ncbi:fasciclin domain-containing protein [Lacinutrix neustonica]|uniref:Fasciclin domain-containing protein n=1 Tax=Lacinutrix neustonica TaxID=2980107 RepID=A0A9E8MXL0_9FLAO|nr:fasciclin domain-containing protein [Lacinutrix neustonica]WAC03538.1 fasciclin domain-containing protein [Lacinutrix neustonica]